MPEKVDTVVLDKTGMITAGRPEVTHLLLPPESSIDVIGDNPHTSEDRVLRIVAALERASEHPLAAAVVRYAQQHGLNLPQLESFESQTGHGVVGIVEGNLTVIGNAALMKNNSISGQTLTAAARTCQARGYYGVPASVATPSARGCQSAGGDRCIQNRRGETLQETREAMSRLTLEVADIIRASGSRFSERHGSHLALQDHKVMDAIVRCRTDTPSVRGRRA